MAKKIKRVSPLDEAAQTLSKGSASRDSIPADFDLEQSVPYLMNRVGVGLGTVFSDHLRRYDLSLPGYRILASLVGRDGQGIVELAQHTSMDVSTLSRLVNTLEAKSLLARQRDEQDARSFKVFLLEEGRQMASQTIPIAMLIEKLMISSLAKDEVDLLKSVLKRMSENLAALLD